jgi:hypothetical protein
VYFPFLRWFTGQRVLTKSVQQMAGEPFATSRAARWPEGRVHKDVHA